MKKKIYKTTKKDFKTFEMAVNHTLSFFHISEYETTLYHKKLPDARGTCHADMENMMCHIEFGTEWSYKPDKKEIERVAFHEIWELLLYPLGSLSLRACSEELVNEETHRVIRRMENVLFNIVFNYRS